MRYLTGTRPCDYLGGPRDAKGVLRDPAPVTVRGDSEQTRRLINQLQGKHHRYISGVLSFRELISPEIEQRIIDRFETAAFAGLEPGQFDCLWIRHAHNNTLEKSTKKILHKRSELHFLVPRCELSTGKALNIRPPGTRSQELFDTFRKLVNHDFHLKDPHPAAARVSAQQIAALRAKLERLTSARARYNRGRFPAPSATVAPLSPVLSYENRTRLVGGSPRPPGARAHDAQPGARRAVDRLGQAAGAVGAAVDQLARPVVRFDRAVGAFRARHSETIGQRGLPTPSLLDHYDIPRRAFTLREMSGPDPEELELTREDGK